MPQKSIVLHIPHASPVFPFGLSSWDEGIDSEITRWTDWYTDWLFASSTRLDSRIVPVSYPFSRFFCDVERLENDPLEQIGQGIVYTRFGTLNRCISDAEKQFAIETYYEHRRRLVQALTPGALLIDCHSFPADLSEVDICIGLNDDWSRPSQDIIDLVVSHFRQEGYRMGINTPYSSSITPAKAFRYKSFMVEVNKRVYLDDRDSLNPAKGQRLRNTISNLYQTLLRWQCFDRVKGK